jgi:hypothetical protein
MAPEPCPVCNEPGGFHDRDIHSGPRPRPSPAGARAVERILRNHAKEETT